MSSTGGFLEAARAGETVEAFDPDEVTAAREGVGVAVRPERALFHVAGDDRHEFLHRMLTTAIRPAADGAGRRALLLDNKGRIEADLDLIEAGDRLLAVGAREACRTAIEGLERFVLRADVRFESEEGVRVLALVGPGTAPLLRELGAEAPDCRPGRVAARLADVEITIAATSALPAGFELLVPADRVEPVARALLGAGASPVGSGTLEILRVEAGVPAPDRELADRPFPQEVRLDAVVDFDKGCYVGQETVARIHYRGQVNRLLCGLELSAEPTASELRDDGRSVGELTTVVRSDLHGEIALGFVRTELAEQGTRLRVGDGEGAVEAGVVEIPFD